MCKDPEPALLRAETEYCEGGTEGGEQLIVR